MSNIVSMSIKQWVLETWLTAFIEQATHHQPRLCAESMDTAQLEFPLLNIHQSSRHSVLGSDVFDEDALKSIIGFTNLITSKNLIDEHVVSDSITMFEVSMICCAKCNTCYGFVKQSLSCQDSSTCLLHHHIKIWCFKGYHYFLMFGENSSYECIFITSTPLHADVSFNEWLNSWKKPLDDSYEMRHESWVFAYQSSQFYHHNVLVI